MQVQLTPHVGQMGNTDGTTTEVEFPSRLDLRRRCLRGFVAEAARLAAAAGS
jgi:hypothetical protein